MGDYNHNQIHLRYSKNQFWFIKLSRAWIKFANTISRFILLAQKYDKLNQFLRKRIFIRNRNIEKSQNI